MSDTASRAFRHNLVRAGAIVLLGAAAYANTLHVPFLFDDFGSIPDNPTLRSVGWAMFAPPREETLSARPISNATFAVNRALTGPAVEGFHVGNLLIHLLAALCLLGLIRRTLRLPRFGGRYDDRADVLATLVAALWVVHPIETESVTYLVQRVESLAGLFILLTLYGSLRAATSRRPRSWAALAVAACLLAMGSKETGVVAPLLVVLFDRAFLFGSFREALRRRGLFYGFLAATWVLLAKLVANNARHFTAGLHFQHFGSFDYLRIQAGAIVHYLRLVVWPYPLVFDYGEPNGGVPLATRLLQWGPPAALLVLLAAASLAAWRRHPALAFLGTAFFVLLGPSSSVIPVTTEAISEHRMYLASATVLMAIVFAADALLQRWRLAAALAAIGVLLVLTVERNRVYRSPTALWEDTIAHWPGNARAYVALADALRAGGDEAGFRQRIREALAVSPTHVVANEREGVIEEEAGHCDTAIPRYRLALERLPDDPDLRYHLAGCLVRTGQMDEAIGDYRRALEHAPNEPAYHVAFANALAHLGRFDQALAQIQIALRLRPNWADGFFDLGGVYVRMGRNAEAYDAFETAARLNPTGAIAHERAGVVAGWLGRTADAERELEEAARLRPGDAEPIEDLAWLLATRPNADGADAPHALSLARSATALSPGSRRAWDVLAAAEAANGQWDDAVRDATEAIKRPVRGYADAPTEAIDQRRATYQKHQRWQAPLKTR